MAYWRLHYHGIWACKERQPLITPKLEPELYKYLWGKALDLGAIMHTVGGIEDHVHIAFSLHPKYSVADFIGKIKGASSHWVTHILNHPDPFDWRREYGVISFGDKRMKQVIHYVLHQKEHHSQQTTNKTFEEWSEDDDGVAGVWDEI